MSGSKKLYVVEALKKTDRQAERFRETIQYKNSKKMCNLYVRGFPSNMTQDELFQLFSPFGEIESLRMFPPEGDKLYAFVCYKSPSDASSAKNSVTINGRTLTINYY